MNNKSRDLMERMGMVSKHPNFLHEIRETFNNAPMVSLNEINAKSLIDRHTKDGYVIISPCRGGADFGLDVNNPKDKEKLASINNKRVKEIIELIKDSGFSYTPVYGGFIENKGTPQEENVYERSFVIYPFDKSGELQDFAELKEFAIAMANRFNQDSVLVCEPNGTPAYINKNGEVDFELGNNVVFNDVAQEYFTDLHKNTDKFGNLNGRTPTRFSYTESYINPAPQCLGERMSRYRSGEIFLSK